MSSYISNVLNIMSFSSNSSLSSSSTSSFLAGLLFGTAATAASIYIINFDGRKHRNFQERHLSQEREDDAVAESGLVPSNIHHRQLERLYPRTAFLRGLNRKLLQKTSAVYGATDDGHGASFFSRMITELWDHIRVAAADRIQSTVEPYFADMPPPVNSARFTRVDLGTVPFKMDRMVVHPSTNDFVQWDFDFEWDSDCDIQITADFIGSFGIKHLKIVGRMSVVFKPLVNEIPIVSAVSYCFLNMPSVNLTFTGLASVAEIGAIKQSIEDVIKASMASSCLPNRRIYKMIDKNTFFDIYRPPVGVLKLKIESGRGFVIEKRLFAADDIPDVYLNVSVGAVAPGSSEGIQKTKTIMDECNPVWNETFEFLLWDRGQEIRLEAWDFDEGPFDPDDELGTNSVAVSDLLLAPQRRKEVALYKDGRKTGEYVTLSCSVDSWTTDLNSLHLQQDSKVDQAEEENYICGLLVVLINRAFNLPLDKKTAATYVRTVFDGHEYKSNIVYDYPGHIDALNPVYDSSFTIPLNSSMKLNDDTRVTLELINAPIDEDDSVDPIVVGSTTVTIWELKKYPENTLTQKRSIDATKNGPMLEFRLSLSGILISSSGGTSATPGVSSPTRAIPTTATATPKNSSENMSNNDDMQVHNFHILGTLGTARITVVGIRGLKIEAHLFDFDVPDCYCVVSFGASKNADPNADSNDDIERIFKTSIKHNNTNPTWNEHHDWPLEDHGEVVSVDVWDHDEDGRGEDTLLGSTKTTIGKLLMAGGATELELKKNGRMTGICLFLQCDIVV